MNLVEYQQFVLKMMSPKSDLATAAIGLCDEVAELFQILTNGGTQEELLKEMGDVLFYHQYGVSKLDYTNADDNPTTHQQWVEDEWGGRTEIITGLPFIANSLVVWSGKIAGCCKKFLYHGHGAACAEWEYHQVLRYLSLIASAFGITLTEVIDANVSKLQARYGDGFSSERSINRYEET
jgi:NTP pyrophosphatase (non-canonical NTP hydrolase)